MKFVSIFLLLLPLISPKLLLLVEYSRHGARSPEHYVRPEIFPEGIKNITPEGMFQHYQIGRELRKRYIDEIKFLPANVTPNTKNIKVFSSGVVRSYASGAAQLMGLYGENTGPVIEGEQIWFKPPFNLTFDDKSKNNTSNNQTTNKNDTTNTTNQTTNHTEQNNNTNQTNNQTNQTSNQSSHDNVTNQTSHDNTTTNHTTNQTGQDNTTNQTTNQTEKENVTNQTTNQTGQDNHTGIDNSTTANQTTKDNSTNQTSTNQTDEANTTNHTSADNITNKTSQNNTTNQTTNQTNQTAKDNATNNTSTNQTSHQTDPIKNQTGKDNTTNQTTNHTFNDNITNNTTTNQTSNQTDPIKNETGKENTTNQTTNQSTTTNQTSNQTSNDNITNQTSNQTTQQNTSNQTNQITNQTQEGNITNQTANKTGESNSTNKTSNQTSNETVKTNTTTSNHSAEQGNTTTQISNKTEQVNNTNQTKSQTNQSNTTNQTSQDNTPQQVSNHTYSNSSDLTTNQTGEQVNQTVSNNATNQTANYTGLNNLSFASTNADFQTFKTNIEKKFAVYNGLGIIPILQMDPKNDLLFQPYKFCPSLVKIGKDLLKDPVYLNLLNQWRQDLFPQLADILQKDYNISVNITNEPLKFIKKFHDVFESVKFHKRGGLDLKFTNETELHLMETRFYTFMNLVHELRPITLKINLSPILEDIVESMMKRIADENMHISEEEKLKFLFFSGRDKQMFALLNLLLGPEDRKLLRQQGDVPFASLFLFELHQDDLNPSRHFVRVSYNDEPLKMKGCTGEKGTCELNEFFKLISGGISDNFYRDCEVIRGRIAFE